jgi:protein-disulfide isomerase
MFSDFQCSACAAVHPLLKEAIASFPQKVRFVIRDFPLESIHKDALAAARAAGAANAQGKFFQYIQILYKNQKAQDEASLRKYAADLGLNMSQFDLDFKSDKILGEIKKDIADGESFAITSTPTVFVNGRRVADLSVGGFKKAIEAALSK